MKQKPDLKPYWHSADMGVNCSLTMRKIYKRIHDVNPAYKPQTRFQKAHKSKRTLYQILHDIKR